MLYQLAEIISASKTLRGTLGLWVLVVDAALCDASAMSDGSPMRSGFLAGAGHNEGMGALRGGHAGTPMSWWRQRWTKSRET